MSILITFFIFSSLMIYSVFTIVELLITPIDDDKLAEIGIQKK